MKDSPLEHQSNQPEAASWLGINVFTPAYKALWQTPASAVIEAVNSVPRAITGKDIITIHTEQTEPTAQPDQWTKEWWTQSLVSGISSAITYSAAGKATGFLLREAAWGLKLKDLATNILTSEKTAQIAGAVLYDSLRETHAGETHKGNAAAGLAGFSIYELSNHLSRKQSLPAKLLYQAGSGAIGSIAQVAVSRTVSGEKLPQWNDRGWQDAALAGAALNFVLPTVQKGMGITIDGVNQLNGRGAPIKRMMDNKNWSERSYRLDELAEELPLVRVLHTKENHSRIDLEKELVYLCKGASAGQLAHELKHLLNHQQNNARWAMEASANYYRQLKPESSWQTYKDSRYDDEVSAVTMEFIVDGHMQSSRTSRPHKIDVLEEYLPAAEKAMDHLDNTNEFYEQIWKKDFDKFISSRYKHRPEIVYSSPNH